MKITKTHKKPQKTHYIILYGEPLFKVAIINGECKLNNVIYNFEKNCLLYNNLLIKVVLSFSN